MAKSINRKGKAVSRLTSNRIDGLFSIEDKVKLDSLVANPGSGSQGPPGPQGPPGSPGLPGINYLSGVYIWNESPAGVINGVNTVFTLEFSPVPSESLQLFKNGLLLRNGSLEDYTIVNNSITFSSQAVPVINDLLRATYVRDETIYLHVFNESPSGILNGSNPTFNLVYEPFPVTSLLLYKNGLLQRSGSPNDFVLAASTITFMTESVPQSSDTLVAYYVRGII